MTGSIFQLNQDDSVTELREARYESEALFQALIGQYPNILAGDQISPEDPRKWILISREMGVPAGENEGAQWFLDHLFLDQDGIPTLVEVKRGSDTRIRREVVGQMLDYAANAQAFWSVSDLRDAYESQCVRARMDPLQDICSSMEELDAYWERVGDHLRSGRLRLLFVADEIPASLQRIIEFLNDQMVNTQVLGLEIKQYVSEGGRRTLVPRLIGQTTAAAQVKSRAAFAWTEETYLERARAVGGEKMAALCGRLLKEFSQMGCRIYWGRGQKQAGFVPIYEGKRRHQLGAVYIYEKWISVEIYFEHFKAPFDTPEKQKELLDLFNAIPNIHISDQRLGKRPSFHCEHLLPPESFARYIGIYQQMLEEIKGFEAELP